jgi:gamma-glutamylcyclotransferase
MARELYFAYASNMEPRRFRRLCPGGALVGPARLPAYRLAFSRYSRQRRGGSADVVPDPDSEVWGALYEVDEDDLAAMDRNEGVPAAYRRQVVTVLDEAGEERQAVTYTANPTGDFLPHKEYLRVILQGAEARGLPPEYVESLRQIRTQ